MQEVISQAAEAGAIPATFLNIIGLLKFMEQNSAYNGTSHSQLAATFSGDFLENKGEGLVENSKEWRAAHQKSREVLHALIANIYVMFPPNGSAQDQEASKELTPVDTEGKKQAQEREQSEMQKLFETESVGKEQELRLQREAELVQARALQAHTEEAAVRRNEGAPKLPDLGGSGWVGFAGVENGNADGETDGVSKLFGENAEKAGMIVNAAGDGHAEEEDDEQGEEEEEDGVPVDFTVVAKFSYTAGDCDELSFETGDKIRITWRASWDENAQEGWYTGELNGAVGQLPSTYVEIVQDNTASVVRSKGGLSSSAEQNSPMAISNVQGGKQTDAVIVESDLAPVSSTGCLSDAMLSRDEDSVHSPPSPSIKSPVSQSTPGSSPRLSSSLRQSPLHTSDHNLAVKVIAAKLSGNWLDDDDDDVISPTHALHPQSNAVDLFRANSANVQSELTEDISSSRAANTLAEPKPNACRLSAAAAQPESPTSKQSERKQQVQQRYIKSEPGEHVSSDEPAAKAESTSRQQRARAQKEEQHIAHTHERPDDFKGDAVRSSQEHLKMEDSIADTHTEERETEGADHAANSHKHAYRSSHDANESRTSVRRVVEQDEEVAKMKLLFGRPGRRKGPAGKLRLASVYRRVI